MAESSRPVLYLMVCGAPTAADVETGVRKAQDAGWRVCVIASPAGRRFIDTERIGAVTGFPVRWDYKMPGEADILPRADGVIVAPATLATTCKFAAGIADTLVVSLLCELLGFDVPILLVPLLKPELARHPAFGEALDRLGQAGVRHGRL
jgi:phosphopantothenoylcysteine synthetase/decarboxylase